MYTESLRNLRLNIPGNDLEIMQVDFMPLSRYLLTRGTRIQSVYREDVFL